MRLALDYQQYETISMDCFAMCANDILSHGPKPLFFLDYLACGQINAEVVTKIIQGMPKVCYTTGTHS
ncbi:MAG: AIR synthase related protein [Flavobacteriales bacterium AspAUS03]